MFRSFPRLPFHPLVFKRNASYRRFGSQPTVSFTRLFQSRYTLYFAGSCIAFYLYNLDEAPFTKRRRLLWVPYWLERKVGDYSYAQIMAQYKNQISPSGDPNYLLILRVMNRLLASAVDNTPDPQQAAHVRLLDWSIHIIRPHGAEEPPNAFILPNGKIFIFLLILPICHDEDGLATVLSHELAHQLAHHSLEQLSKQPIYLALSTLLYMATGISWFNDLLIAGLLQMPALREMESEADRIGCELMAHLCFDVTRAVDFWARMGAWEQKSQKATPMLEFLSTHPNTQKRMADIRSWMPALEQIRESSDCYHWKSFLDFHRNFFGKR